MEKGRTVQRYADSAAKNIWEARIAIRAQAPQVVLAAVTPFRITIVEETGTGDIPGGS